MPQTSIVASGGKFGLVHDPSRTLPDQTKRPKVTLVSEEVLAKGASINRVWLTFDEDPRDTYSRTRGGARRVQSNPFNQEGSKGTQATSLAEEAGAVPAANCVPMVSLVDEVDGTDETDAFIREVRPLWSRRREEHAAIDGRTSGANTLSSSSSSGDKPKDGGHVLSSSSSFHRCRLLCSRIEPTESMLIAYIMWTCGLSFKEAKRSFMEFKTERMRLVTSTANSNTSNQPPSTTKQCLIHRRILYAMHNLWFVQLPKSQVEGNNGVQSTTATTKPSSRSGTPSASVSMQAYSAGSDTLQAYQQRFGSRIFVFPFTYPVHVEPVLFQAPQRHEPRLLIGCTLSTPPWMYQMTYNDDVKLSALSSKAGSLSAFPPAERRRILFANTSALFAQKARKFMLDGGSGGVGVRNGGGGGGDDGGGGGKKSHPIESDDAIVEARVCNLPDGYSMAEFMSLLAKASERAELSTLSAFIRSIQVFDSMPIVATVPKSSAIAQSTVTAAYSPRGESAATTTTRASNSNKSPSTWLHQVRSTSDGSSSSTATVNATALVAPNPIATIPMSIEDEENARNFTDFVMSCINQKLASVQAPKQEEDQPYHYTTDDGEVTALLQTVNEEEEEDVLLMEAPPAKRRRGRPRKNREQASNDDQKKKKHKTTTTKQQKEGKKRSSKKRSDTINEEDQVGYNTLPIASNMEHTGYTNDNEGAMMMTTYETAPSSSWYGGAGGCGGSSASTSYAHTYDLHDASSRGAISSAMMIDESSRPFGYGLGYSEASNDPFALFLSEASHDQFFFGGGGGGGSSNSNHPTFGSVYQQPQQHYHHQPTPFGLDQPYQEQNHHEEPDDASATARDELTGSHDNVATMALDNQQHQSETEESDTSGAITAKVAAAASTYPRPRTANNRKPKSSPVLGPDNLVTRVMPLATTITDTANARMIGLLREEANAIQRSAAAVAEFEQQGSHLVLHDHVAIMPTSPSSSSSVTTNLVSNECSQYIDDDRGEQQQQQQQHHQLSPHQSLTSSSASTVVQQNKKKRSRSQQQQQQQTVSGQRREPSIAFWASRSSIAKIWHLLEEVNLQSDPTERIVLQQKAVKSQVIGVYVHEPKDIANTMRAYKSQFLAQLQRHVREMNSSSSSSSSSSPTITVYDYRIGKEVQMEIPSRDDFDGWAQFVSAFTQEPLRRYLLEYFKLVLKATGVSPANNSIAALIRTNAFDATKAPRLSGLQHQQLLDAYYWAYLAGDDEKDPRSLAVVQFYSSMGVLVKMKNSYDQTGFHTGRNPGTGVVRKYAPHRIGQYSIAAACHTKLVVAGSGSDVPSAVDDAVSSSSPSSSSMGDVSSAAATTQPQMSNPIAAAAVVPRKTKVSSSKYLLVARQGVQTPFNYGVVGYSGSAALEAKRPAGLPLFVFKSVHHSGKNMEHVLPKELVDYYSGGGAATTKHSSTAQDDVATTFTAATTAGEQPQYESNSMDISGDDEERQHQQADVVGAPPEIVLEAGELAPVDIILKPLIGLPQVQKVL